jgi:hypothetical protein
LIGSLTLGMLTSLSKAPKSLPSSSLDKPI